MNDRVLILGGSGMLGHRAYLEFRQRFDTKVTLRGLDGLPPVFNQAHVVSPVEARNLETVERCIASMKPTVVINCVGIVKQLASARDPVVSLTINSLFPHQVAGFCRSAGARLIHLSTDCVFSGRKGMYVESDRPDPEDLYGQTKLLGEVATDGALTIRTSIIGRELRTTTGLVEWLLSHRGGTVQGYKRAIFSGLTTEALARILAEIVANHPNLTGLYHVAADPISKCDLLGRLNAQFRAGIIVEPSDAVQIDRSLDGSRFRAATQISAPSWNSMIAAMAADPTPYEHWRRTVVS
ncbi:MAG TPA: SDR family oxidoreductase [Vicinamibacterales bacterium]|nr:SDR family oxidoreductase [Vicinamibacterales bacterium]